MNCCDDYGNCTQNKNCPIRTYQGCNQNCDQGRNCSCSNQHLNQSNETSSYIYLFSLLGIALVVLVLIIHYLGIAQ
jgi:hypothetical protein